MYEPQQHHDSAHLIRLFVPTLLLLILGCSSEAIPSTGSSSAPKGDLVVFAAASLADAFPEIADAFQRAHPGTSVQFNFAGSQRLRAQLEYGAKAGVFASADQFQMDLAVRSGVISGSPERFASNRLVVITPLVDGPNGAGNGERVQELGDLAREGVKLALALPDVPVGVYTRTVLEKLAGRDDGFGADYPERVLANAVTLEPNVRGVVQKVILGEVDAGIVYWTDASTVYVASRVTVIPIPNVSNITAGYPIATLKDSPNPALGEAFVRFILTGPSQVILRDRGFGAPAVLENSPQQSGASGR